MCMCVCVCVYIYIYVCVYTYMDFPVVQMVKNLPAVQEIWVPSLGRKDPLEEGLTTHSSILAWIFHEQRSLVSYSP